VRTTITLDPDTRLLVERAMRERGLSFNEVVSEAIRTGLRARGIAPPTYTEPRTLGPAQVDLTKALQLAGNREDDALAHRLADA
jgi:hypothetical protein